MRILVYEQFHPGHYYQYPHFLLPELLKIANDVVVAIPPEGRASAEFAELLAPYQDRVAFEPILPNGHDRVIKNEKWRLHQDLRSAVRHVRPDYVLVPSADTQTTAMGLFRLAGLGGLPGHRPGEAGIHLGPSASPHPARRLLKDTFDGMKFVASGWKRLHIVNFLHFEQLQASGVLSRKIAILPHPVKPNALSKTDGRRLLGLPTDGRLIGIAGVIDYRKAVPEFLSAFRSATDRVSDRLLLAGPVAAEYLALLQADYRDLIDSGRIILLDRFLDTRSNEAAFAAMDVVCVPYPGFLGLSGVFLQGLAAGRPVLANDEGWCGAIVRRFGCGWLCNVRSRQDFVTAMRMAFDGCETYKPTQAADRLVTFHSPENFTSSFLSGLRVFAGLAPSPATKSWNWVTSASGAN